MDDAVASAAIHDQSNEEDYGAKVLPEGSSGAPEYFDVDASAHPEDIKYQDAEASSYPEVSEDVTE